MTITAVSIDGITRAAVALLLLVIPSAGCRERTCAGADAPVLEVRDRGGAVEISLRMLGDGLAVCDARDRRVGAVSGNKAGLALADASGAETLRLAPGPDPGDTLATRPGGSPPLRLHDEDGLLRVLDPQGVPLAQLGADPQSRRALAYDPAGNPLAYAERAEDRRVVRGRDGAVQHYVLGARSDRAAAAMALPMFPPAERLLLCRWLDLR